MSTQTNAAPVIIKRKKVVAGGGHHGGAWKVAYADFVTAMMAFFMLMWLLNATTEQQRKGLADYFSPTVPVNRISGGGDGSFGGDSLQSEDILTQMGLGASNRFPSEAHQAWGATGTSTEIDTLDKELAELESQLLGRSGESMVEDNVFRQIITRVTEEGLVIELFALEGSPLFQTNSSRPTPLLRDMAAVLSYNLKNFRNDLAISTHIRADPVVLAGSNVWNSTTERAKTMRKLLIQKGTSDQRIKKITGHGAMSPSEFDPMSIRNNRIELVVLRNDRRG